MNETGNNTISIARHLTMASLSGLITLRAYRERYPTITTAEAVSLLRTQFFDTAYYDYEAASELEPLIPSITLTPRSQGLQTILAALITIARPWWWRLFLLGRERVLAALTIDQVQCFVSAGLTTHDPDARVIAWWDQLAQMVRQRQHDANLQAGRAGERLTLTYEKKRLMHLGIDREPRWMSIENNMVGYDVRSFDPGLVNPVNRLIEVKACSSHPLAFHLTQNEWNTALKSRGSYVFHIWHLPSETLHELSPDDIAPHIPMNRGNGKWETTFITLPEQSNQATRLSRVHRSQVVR